jgi:hypothetical protein
MVSNKEMIYHHCPSTMLYNMPFWKVQEGMEVNGTHHLLLCADGVHLLGENINCIKKNIKALLDVSKKVSLQINTEKTRYMFMFHHQTTGLNHKSLRNVAKFKLPANNSNKSKLHL